MGDRVILHCDMNSFFASVELLSHPELKDKPVAVAGDADKRHGIILAKNEFAKKAGVVTAETIWSARKKCPALILLPPHMHTYKEYFHKLNAIYQRYTDLVEPFSIDESWLDVTSSQMLFGDGRAIADSIRETVKSELGLTLSAGVSYNKIFAKMGSDYKKPDATTVITRENYKDILWPLPVGELFFAGRSTVAKLSSVGIKTIGDLALTNEDVLSGLLGKSGTLLWKYANGLDDSPVSKFGVTERPKSIGNGVTFKRDLVSYDDIVTASVSLADTVASRLRAEHMKASGIKIDIKDPYFKSISRQKQLSVATNLTDDIKNAAIELILANWEIGNPIRLLTVTGINLIDEFDDVQLSIFSGDESERMRGEKFERTMDEVRKKYGSKSISFASVIDKDI